MFIFKIFSPFPNCVRISDGSLSCSSVSGHVERCVLGVDSVNVPAELLKYPVIDNLSLEGDRADKGPDWSFRSLEELCLTFLDECVAVCQKPKRFLNACGFDHIRKATEDHLIWIMELLNELGAFTPHISNAMRCSYKNVLKEWVFTSIFNQGWFESSWYSKTHIRCVNLLQAPLYECVLSSKHKEIQRMPHNRIDSEFMLKRVGCFVISSFLSHCGMWIPGIEYNMAHDLRGKSGDYSTFSD
jgi:hypothetical protein